MRVIRSLKKLLVFRRYKFYCYVVCEYKRKIKRIASTTNNVSNS